MLADLDQCAPAAFRRQAVRRDVHDALQDHVIVELALLEPFAADDAIVELGDTSLADVDAGAAELRRGAGIVGEQRRDVAAQLLVDVVAVGALQALDGLRVLEQAELVLEPRELGFERREPCGLGVGFLGTAGADPQHGAERNDAGRACDLG